MTEAILRHDGVPVKYNGPGILCFFSGAGHAHRAIRAAVGARQGTAEPLKIGIAAGRVYLGSIGHPDYRRSDVIGEPVSIALLAADWAADNTASGLACTACTLEAVDEEQRGSLLTGKPVAARLPGIEHPVQLDRDRHIAASSAGCGMCEDWRCAPAPLSLAVRPAGTE